MSVTEILKTLLINFEMLATGNAVEQQTLFDWVKESLRQTVGPPLKAIHQPFDEWLGTLPMSVALGCVLALYAVALIWVWTLRREFVFRGAPDQKWWRDLRVWATIVTIPYVAVYLLLGR
jgi:ABC-type uncharacterized transport system permease subunit